MTTVDFPAELFRKAKIRAAARGESLKTLLTRALAAEVAHDGDRTTPRRMTLPLFGDPKGPLVDLRASELARCLADEDAAQVGGRRRRR